MRISSKTRYALRILLDIAYHGKNDPRTIRSIAASQEISEKFASPLVVTLRRAGLLKSLRGVNGGLLLAKPPEFISLLDVVNAMDGEIFLLDCLKTSNACPRKERCMTARFWNDINETIRDKFRSITLKAILDQYISGKLNEETYSI